MVVKIILSKYKLPNGNVFFWLGTGGIWGKTTGIDNVLVLDGGDVLFLETTKVISLHKEGVREDIKNLNHEEFAKKYELPTNGELWRELKQGVKTGRYPPFLENPEERVREFRGMISAYITNILQLRDPEEKIRQLEAIIGKCHRKILEIEEELRK